MIDPTSPPSDSSAEAVPPTDEGTRASRARARQDDRHERWRERLVSGGKDALHEYADEHPMADLPQLRQLLRQARRHPGSGKSKQALGELLRIIREISDVEASVRRASTSSG